MSGIQVISLYVISTHKLDPQRKVHIFLIFSGHCVAPTEWNDTICQLKFNIIPLITEKEILDKFLDSALQPQQFSLADREILQRTISGWPLAYKHLKNAAYTVKKEDVNNVLSYLMHFLKRDIVHKPIKIDAVETLLCAASGESVNLEEKKTLWSPADSGLINLIPVNNNQYKVEIPFINFMHVLAIYPYGFCNWGPLLTNAIQSLPLSLVDLRIRLQLTNQREFRHFLLYNDINVSSGGKI